MSSLVEDECSRTLVETDDCLGIVPVIVTPANALYFQEMLASIEEQEGIDNFS